jgi:hypothetical protein
MALKPPLAKSAEEVRELASTHRLFDPCPASDRFHLSYIAFFEDAERREAAGEAQHFCGNCERWRWPDHRAACQFFEWKSMDPCPDAPKGAHHPECGRGFPELGCHAECPTKYRSLAVLDGSYKPSENP